MAAPIAALTPELPPTHGGQLLRDFVAAFDCVQEQLQKGGTQAVVPLTDISLLGSEGVGILKKHLEDATNSRFAFNIDASANSVTLMPTGPMPPKPAVAAHTPAGKASNIARPMNMFVIYRKEWHPKVAAENPGLHNNKISKIIGKQWRAESEEVREEYKRKADDVKRQFDIANPGYRYQPRKPSEKKRRMTKTKLAKIAAKAQENGNIDGPIVQEPLPDDFDPFTMLDEHLGARAATQPMTVTEYGTMPAPPRQNLRPTQDIGVFAFESGADEFAELTTSLTAYNAAHTAYNPNVSIQTEALTAQPTSNGKWVDPTAPHNYPGVDFYKQDEIATEFADAELTQSYGQSQQVILPHDPAAEIRRMEDLEFEMDQWIDVNAYGSG